MKATELDTPALIVDLDVFERNLHRVADYARAQGFTVEVGTLEDWDPAGRRFDLVVAGQAWHWVNPHAGATKALSVLRPGGRIGLFWNWARHPGHVQSHVPKRGPARFELQGTLLRGDAMAPELPPERGRYDLGELARRGRRLVPRLHEFYDATALLLRPGALLMGVGLAVLSWLCECVAFLVILRAFPGVQATLLIATFIYAMMTVAGMTDINARTFIVTAAGATLTLSDTFGRPVDATAYGVYSGQNTQIQSLAAKVMQLDHALADYGPEANPARAQLRF